MSCQHFKIFGSWNSLWETILAGDPIIYRQLKKQLLYSQCCFLHASPIQCMHTTDRPCIFVNIILKIESPLNQELYHKNILISFKASTRPNIHLITKLGIVNIQQVYVVDTFGLVNLWSWRSPVILITWETTALEVYLYSSLLCVCSINTTMKNS